MLPSKNLNLWLYSCRSLKGKQQSDFKTLSKGKNFLFLIIISLHLSPPHVVSLLHTRTHSHTHSHINISLTLSFIFAIALKKQARAQTHTHTHTHTRTRIPTHTRTHTHSLSLPNKHLQQPENILISPEVAFCTFLSFFHFLRKPEWKQNQGIRI